MGKKHVHWQRLDALLFSPPNRWAATETAGCVSPTTRLASVMDSIRVHGKGSDKYDNVRIGINGRMDTLQAAILLAKFSIFPEEVVLRQKVADGYRRLLGGCKSFQVPVVPPGYNSVWAQYSVLAASEEHRKKAQAALKEASIPTAVYYPKPLHLQTAFSPLGYKEGDFPLQRGRIAQDLQPADAPLSHARGTGKDCRRFQAMRWVR